MTFIYCIAILLNKSKSISKYIYYNMKYIYYNIFNNSTSYILTSHKQSLNMKIQISISKHVLQQNHKALQLQNWVIRRIRITGIEYFINITLDRGILKAYFKDTFLNM